MLKFLPFSLSAQRKIGRGVVIVGLLLNGLPQIGIGQDLVQYVQPLAGTAASTTAASLKHGSGTEHLANTIPAVGTPFGMTQWTPQTRLSETKCQAPYYFRDSLLTGFRASHWLSGSCTQDYGSVTLMPITGKLDTKAARYAAPYSHRTETASPAYYRVQLPRYQLTTELTATARCAMLQVTAAQADSLYLLITPNSDQGQGFVQVDAQRGEVWGYNPVHRIYQGWGEAAGFSGYFVVQVERTGGRHVQRRPAFRRGAAAKPPGTGCLPRLSGAEGRNPAHPGRHVF